MDDHGNSLGGSFGYLGHDGVDCVVDPLAHSGVAGLVHREVEGLCREEGLLGVNGAIIEDSMDRDGEEISEGVE